MSTPATSEPTTTATPRRAFEVVLDHIEQMVLDGTLAIGDRLPAERDMAVQLGVSRPAIREAIRTLEAQGVLSSRVGSGVTAGTHVIGERSSALTRLLRLQVALAQFPVDEVTTARATLERSSCLLAAANADDAGLAGLASMVETMADTLDVDAYNELDTAFHLRISELGGNTLMGDLTSAIRESLRRPIHAAERALEEWPTFRDGMQEGHRAIVEALVARDGARAADLMDAHIQLAHDTMRPYLTLPPGR